MKNSPSPPKAVSTEAKRWWRAIQVEFEINDPGGLAILACAAKAFDRMREAQALIKSQGMTTSDRFGQVKTHPAVLIERDSRSQILAALKQLNLDVEPLNERPGRPNGR